MKSFSLWVDPQLKISEEHTSAIINTQENYLVDDHIEADAFLCTENFCQENNVLEIVGVKPLIIFQPRDVIPEFILEDLTPTSIMSVLETVTPICQKLSQLDENIHETHQDIFYAGLIYIWSRGINQGSIISPILNPRLNKGYGYPYFDTVIQSLNKKSLSGVDIFKYLEESGYLVSLPFEVAQTCPKCHSIMLLLRDSCINCASPSIQEEVLIHHFSCGYQASESRFIVTNDVLLQEYVCPKCRKPLRHFGVDYDKPGSIYHCTECNNENAETEVALRCMSCQYIGTANDSKKISISSYELTNQGRRIITSGERNIFNVGRLLKDTLSLVPFDTFCFLLEKVERLRSYEGSIILTIELSVTDNSLESYNDTQMLVELGKVVIRHIRKSDTVSLYKGALFILFSETDEAIVDKIIRLEKVDLSEALNPDILKRISFKTVTGKEFLHQLGLMQ